MKQLKGIKKTKTIPFAPTDAPDPWGQAFESVQNRVVISNDLASSGDRFALHITDVTLIASLHWVYKKRWKSRYPIPASAKEFESWGDLFCIFLELCIELHYLHPLGLGYVNAGEWFLGICREFRRDGFAAGKRKHSKKIDLESLRKDIKVFQDRQNPIDPDKNPHTWAIVEAASQCCNKSETIDDLWFGYGAKSKGFVPALKRLCTELDKGTKAAFWVESQQVLIQDKKGRGLIECKNPLIESFFSGAKTFN